MDYIVGIDGGASKTIVLLVDREGSIRAIRESGPANYHTVGLEVAIDHIAEVMNSALTEAHITDFKNVLVIMGLAGIDRPKDEERMRQLLLHRFDSLNNTSLVLVNDAYIALVGAVKGEHGVVVNAGTGVIAMGINSARKSARAGGWGYLLGDEGGGYWIGKQALKAVLRGYDGRGRTTILCDLIKKHFSLDQMEDILEVVYNRKLAPQEIASLTPLVFEGAEAEDKVAISILERAGQELGLSARAVIERLDMAGEEFKLATIGGVFKGNYTKPLMDSFAKVVRKVAPHCQIIEPAYPPEVGAILVGLLHQYGKIPPSWFEYLNRAYQGRDKY